MKKWFLLTAVLLVTLLTGAEFEINSGKFHCLFDTAGGGIKQLKAGKQEYNYPGRKSFTERFFALQGNAIRFERFTDLNFTLDKFAVENKHDQRIILSAGGISTFDWLRVTKNFFFPHGQNYFTVTYTLKNRDSVPHTTAMWLQTYLGPADDSGARVRIFQPRQGKLFEVTNPGNASANEWSPRPGLSVSAVCGKEDPAGLMLSLPGSAVAGYYSWTGSKKGKPGHTCEVLTREWTIAPGKEITFTLRIDHDKNIAQRIKAQISKPEYIIPAGTPPPAAFPGKRNVKWLQPKGGELPDPARFVEFKLKRQFLPSIRSILIPAKEKFTQAAVFPVYNGRIDRDRPFKSVVRQLPDGSKRLLFEVPGVAPKGFYYTIIKDNFAYDNWGGPKYKRPLGEVELTCVAALDSPVRAPHLAADKAELVYNGSFEKPNSAGTFADGNFWSENTLSRKTFFWEKGAGMQGSYGIRLKKNSSKFHSNHHLYFLPEPGVKYTIAADLRTENPDRMHTVFSTSTLDGDRKLLMDPNRKSIKVAKESYNWNRFSGYSVPGNKAKFLLVNFSLSSKSRDNFMLIDNVSVVPEEFHFTPKPALESAREKAILSGYLPLPDLEKISHAFVTPHEKWFTPMAEKCPQLLYACTILGSNEDASRREIVELAQRMDLTYEFIPLLPKCLGIVSNGIFGVNRSNLANIFDAYSLERFRALKQFPKAALIQGVNFKQHDANGALASEIAKLQAKGTQIIFLNCLSIPQKLLGKRASLPQNWNVLPVFQSAKNMQKYCRSFSKGDVFAFSDAHYLKLHSFVSTPPEYADQTTPAYTGRDFPFWEYRYLPLIKSILARSGIKQQVKLLEAVHKDNALEFKLHSSKAASCTLEVIFKAMTRECNGKKVQTFSLKQGLNTFRLPLPPLPGGTSIAHCRLLNEQGAVHDAGAVKTEIPHSALLQLSFKASDRCYSFKRPVDFTVKSEKFLPGDTVTVRIEDTDCREVFRKEYKAVPLLSVSASLLPPFTTLNRVLVELRRNGRIIERTMGEFSFSDRTLDPTDYQAGMWGGRLILTGMLRELGFDLFSASATRESVKSGYLRNLLNHGFFPLVLNFGSVGTTKAQSLTYRSDAAAPPVRVPCFSDPAFKALADKTIEKFVKMNQMRYYTCIYHQLGDEMFLGSTVCFSPHCLKYFRSEMQKQYKTIARLNAVWQRNYKSFDEVTPVQRKEVENSSNLAPWLDHKVFMSRVYAERFVGARAKTIQKYVPGALVGMSGTQVPGYGYDWWQLMKHIGCIAYYSGVQRTLVNDFAPVQRLTGQWGGGYTSSHALFESYQKSPQWSNLFKGANTAWNWHGSAYNGDGSPTANLLAYAEEFNLLKQGIGKLLLSARTSDRSIAVLYSQSSLFTAMAGGIGIAEWQNTQTGWDALLRDLKTDFRFISYENLADPGFSLDSFKVIVLPMALALSDAERTRLTEFARKGGTVIADIAPGRYDNHGKRISGTVLDQLFPANTAEIAPRTVTLSQGTLKGAFRQAENNIKVMTVTPCGKGKGILLNVMLNSYQAVALGGVGGETATAKSGSALYCDSIQQTVRTLLTQAGVRPHAVVTLPDGALAASESVLKKDGCNAFFGLLRSGSGRSGRGRIDHANAPLLTVKLPVSGVIYDVRTGKIIGRANSFKVKAPSGYGQLFAILPREVKAPAVKVPGQVKAGELVHVTLASAGAQGPTVYRMELRDPSGKLQRAYSKNTRFATPEGAFSFQIPFNARQGSWRLTLIHAASRQQKDVTFTVK